MAPTRSSVKRAQLHINDPATIATALETTPQETFRIERLNALSDGVFAIALTLLVLELKLPDAAAGEDFLDAVTQDWHVFLAWLISFVAIARFWIVHHFVVAHMDRCHTGTIAINFAVLGAVSLMPFTADAIGTDKITEPWSTVAFAANLGLMSLALGLLARHVVNEPGLHHPDQPPAGLDFHRLHYLYRLPAITIAAGLLAFVHPYLAIGVLVAEVLVVAWLGRRRRRSPATSPPPGPD